MFQLMRKLRAIRGLQRAARGARLRGLMATGLRGGGQGLRGGGQGLRGARGLRGGARGLRGIRGLGAPSARRAARARFR